MTPEKDESIPQGQTLAQLNPIETRTTDLQIGEQDKSVSLPSVPNSRTGTRISKPRVYLTGTEGLVWDIQGTFDNSYSVSDLHLN